MAQSSLSSSLKITQIDSAKPRPSSAVSRFSNPKTLSHYIFPLSRSKQNSSLQKFSPHMMQIKSISEKSLPKDTQNTKTFEFYTKNFEQVSKSGPIKGKHQEVISTLALQSIPEKKDFIDQKFNPGISESIFRPKSSDFKTSRPGTARTARTFNSESSIFSIERTFSTKILPKRGLECAIQGKEVWNNPNNTRKSVEESQDLIIQPENLSKFSDFQKFVNLETESSKLCPLLKLARPSRSLQRFESFSNFGMTISAKPLTQRPLSRIQNSFKLK